MLPSEKSNHEEVDFEALWVLLVDLIYSKFWSSFCIRSGHCLCTKMLC